jgi:DNA repair protein RecO (recombination protein O)
VLRTQELGEADLIVSLLTESHGKVRGVAPHARKSRKRFGGSLEPLTHVRASWREKAGRDLHRIESLECVRSFAAMQSDPLLQAACAVLSELSEAFAREGQADSKSFRLLGAALVALEEGADSWVVIRYFEYWILRLHGLLPDLQSCSGCSSDLPPGRPIRVVSRRGPLCRDCLAASGERGMSLTAEHLGFITAARRSLPSQMSGLSAAARPGSALEALLRGTLESFAERSFRTYRHLQAASRLDADWSGQS